MEIEEEKKCKVQVKKYHRKLYTKFCCICTVFSFKNWKLISIFAISSLMWKFVFLSELLPTFVPPPLHDSSVNAKEMGSENQMEEGRRVFPLVTTTECVTDLE